MVLLRGSYLHAEITQVLIEGLEESIRIMGPEGLQDILVVFAVIADMQDTRVHSPAELSIGTAHAAHAGRQLFIGISVTTQTKQGIVEIHIAFPMFAGRLIVTQA